MGDITRCVILILPSQKNKTKKIEKNLDNYHLMRYNIKAVANAAIAQSVERILGKDEVASSNLASSSKKKHIRRDVLLFGFVDYMEPGNQFKSAWYFNQMRCKDHGFP